jgi:D-serine dehydratase
VDRLVSGCITINDDRLFRFLKALFDEENIKVEPSAAAGMIGPAMLMKTNAGRRYLEDHHLTGNMSGATHLFWATGGSMVPPEIWKAYYSAY